MTTATSGMQEHDREHLRRLICESILAALGQRRDAVAAAEKAAQAYAAGLAAFDAADESKRLECFAVSTGIGNALGIPSEFAGKQVVRAQAPCVPTPEKVMTIAQSSARERPGED